MDFRSPPTQRRRISKSSLSFPFDSSLRLTRKGPLGSRSQQSRKKVPTDHNSIMSVGVSPRRRPDEGRTTPNKFLNVRSCRIGESNENKIAVPLVESVTECSSKHSGQLDADSANSLEFLLPTPDSTPAKVVPARRSLPEMQKQSSHPELTTKVAAPRFQCSSRKAAMRSWSLTKNEEGRENNSSKFKNNNYNNNDEAKKSNGSSSLPPQKMKHSKKRSRSHPQRQKTPPNGKELRFDDRPKNRSDIIEDRHIMETRYCRAFKNNSNNNSMRDISGTSSPFTKEEFSSVHYQVDRQLSRIGRPKSLSPSPYTQVKIYNDQLYANHQQSGAKQKPPRPRLVSFEAVEDKRLSQRGYLGWTSFIDRTDSAKMERLKSSPLQSSQIGERPIAWINHSVAPYSKSRKKVSSLLDDPRLYYDSTRSKTAPHRHQELKSFQGSCLPSSKSVSLDPSNQTRGALFQIRKFHNSDVGRLLRETPPPPQIKPTTIDSLFADSFDAGIPYTTPPKQKKSTLVNGPVLIEWRSLTDINHLKYEGRLLHNNSSDASPPSDKKRDTQMMASTKKALAGLEERPRQMSQEFWGQSSKNVSSSESRPKTFSMVETLLSGSNPSEFYRPSPREDIGCVGRLRSTDPKDTTSSGGGSSITTGGSHESSIKPDVPTRRLVTSQSSTALLSMLRNFLGGGRQEDGEEKQPGAQALHNADAMLSQSNNLMFQNLNCMPQIGTKLTDMSAVMDPQYLIHTNSFCPMSQEAAFRKSFNGPHPLQFRDFTKVLRDNPSETLLNNASSPDNTLIIWDWDDTILPTYFLAVEHHLNISDSYIPDALRAPLCELESRCLKSLELSMKNGCTILVTNASFRWLTDSAEKYFPQLWDFIKRHRIKILSARDVCQSLGLPQPDWKKMLIRDQIERFFEHLDVPVQVVSDIVAKVKNIQVDDNFIAKMGAPSQIDGITSLSPDLQFYIDPSISEDCRVDRFIRRCSDIFGVDARVLAMTGLLLSDADRSTQGSSCLGELSEDPGSTTSTQGDPVDDPGLTTRVHLRYMTELQQQGGFDLTIAARSASLNIMTQLDQLANPDNPDGLTICPYHEHQVDSELADIIGSAPGTRATSFVRLTTGDLISMKDLFPTPPSDLGLAPVPCSVISIGDGPVEREAVLSVMTQWDRHHRTVLQQLQLLRDELYGRLFTRLVKAITPEGKRSRSSSRSKEPIGVPESPRAPSLQSKLKAPSAAWSFKALKLAPHPTIEQLSQTHDKIQPALSLILQVKHSIDATIEDFMSTNPPSTYTQYPKSFKASTLLRTSSLPPNHAPTRLSVNFTPKKSPQIYTPLRPTRPMFLNEFHTTSRLVPSTTLQ